MNLAKPSLLVLLLLANLANAGCLARYQELPAVENTIIVTDAATGEKIDDFLLVIVYKEGPEELLVGPAHAGPSISRTIRVEIVRLNCGDTLKQGSLTREQWYTARGPVSRFHAIGYDVFKDGYQPNSFDGNMVVGLSKACKPVQVKLEVEKPGNVRSDRLVIIYADSMVNNVIPFTASTAKNRSTLLSLLERQVERVVAGGKYKDPYPGLLSAKEILEKLKQTEVSPCGAKTGKSCLGNREIVPEIVPVTFKAHN